ncbi:filamin-a, partial [Plakobranchus ocellatus]
LENCQSAMKLARQNFNIPLVLRPENLASEDLDELSAITYLSYFTRIGGPGYDATLQRVVPRTLPAAVGNFTTDWQDGQALVNLVRSAGGTVELQDNRDRVSTLQAALDAGRQQLGIEPILSAKEIAAQHTHHLGMMTYSAQYFRYKNVMPYEGYTVSEPRSVITNNVSYNGMNGGPKDNVTVIRTNYNNQHNYQHPNNNNNSISSNIDSNYLIRNGHLSVSNTNLHNEITKPLRYRNLPSSIDSRKRNTSKHWFWNRNMTIDKHPSLHDQKGASFTRRSNLSGLSNLTGLREHGFSRSMSLPRSSYDSSSWSYEERHSVKPTSSSTFSSSSIKRDDGSIRNSLRDDFSFTSPLYSNLAASSEITPAYGSLYRHGKSSGTYGNLPRNEELMSPRSYISLPRDSQTSPSTSTFSPSSARTSSIYDSMLSPTNGVSPNPKNRFREDRVMSNYYRCATTKASKGANSPNSISSSSTVTNQGIDPKFRIKSSDPKHRISPPQSPSGYVRLQHLSDMNGNPLSHSPYSPGSDLSSLRAEETLTTTLANLKPEESTVATVHSPPAYPVDAVNATSFYPGDVDYVHTYNKYNEMRHVSFIDYKVTTVYDNDDAASTHASTIASTASTAPPVFHLLRKSDVHAARVEAPTTDQLKVDIYSVGVIMDSKVVNGL